MEQRRCGPTRSDSTSKPALTTCGGEITSWKPGRNAAAEAAEPLWLPAVGLWRRGGSLSTKKNELLELAAARRFASVGVSCCGEYGFISESEYTRIAPL